MSNIATDKEYEWVENYFSNDGEMCRNCRYFYEEPDVNFGKRS